MSTEFSSKLHHWFQRGLWLSLSAVVVVSVIIGAVLMASVLLGIGLIVLLLATVGVMFGRSRRAGAGYRFEHTENGPHRVLEGDYIVLSGESENTPAQPGRQKNNS